MFRKTIVLTIVMLLALTSFTYALDGGNTIKLVSPQLDEFGQVKYASTLNITLELADDTAAYLQLVRIDPPDMPFANAEVLAAINGMVSKAPTAWLQDLKADGAYDPAPQINIDNYYQPAMSDADLRAVYIAQGDRVIESNAAYVQAFYNAREHFSATELKVMINERQLLVNDLPELYLARNEYEKQAILFLILQQKYNSRFRYTVVSQVPVRQDGPLPYFNYAISDIDPAKYEIIVRDSKTNNLLMPKCRFVVVD